MADPGYETRDIALKPLVLGAIGLAAMLLFFAALMWPTFGYLVDLEARRSAPRHPLAAESARPLPPEPRLQTDPRRDLAEMRAREEAVLGAYAWNDDARTSASVPIERAMELLLQSR